MEETSQTPAELESTLRTVRPPSSTGLERRLGLASVLQAAGVAPRTPSKIGRFELVGKLGAGAMGQVFEARDPELDRLVAIKVLREPTPVPVASGEVQAALTESGREPLSYRSPETGLSARETIRREARALARLTHPNVVAVYDVGEVDGQVFIAMEHVPGGSLRRKLRRDPPADWIALLRLFLQAGAGLAAAHESGVIHRDFKTDNVLLDGAGRAKVADFGLARLDYDAGDPTVPAGYRVGTKLYMAPEINAGAAAGPESDQYSFCASLLSALTEYGHAAPLTIRAALTRGIRDDPDERWPSMQALLDVLHRAIEQPADRHRVSLIDRVQRIWIEGVLEASLPRERGAAPLGIAEAPELVESPWEQSPARRRHFSAKSIDTSDLPAVLDQSNGALLVVGAPGSGKTTALLGLTRALLETARTSDAAPIPVVLNLASFEGSFHRRGGLKAWIEREVVTKYRLPRQRVARWLESDELVLLLDGLDELAGRHRRSAIESINEFRREHPVPLVIACREDEYVANEARLALGTAVRLRPVDPTDLERWGFSPDQAAKVDENDARLRTPLWLTLAAARGSALDQRETWSDVYRAYVDAAIDRPPELDSATRALYRRRLEWIARNMLRRGDADVWLERMQYTWLPGLGRQALAIALGTVVVSLVATVPCMLGSLAVGRSALSGFILGLASLLIPLTFNGGLRVSTGERIRWSWRAALRRAPLMAAIGSGIAVAYSLAMSRPLDAMLYLGGVGGTAVGVLLGLDFADRSSGIKPSDSLRLCARQATMVWFGTWAVMATLFAFVIIQPYVRMFPTMVDAYPGINVPVMYAVQLSTIVATALSLLYGGISVIMHGAVRLVLAATSPLPLRLVRWLDDATRRGLLRRVGGGYMFMHATMLRTLAERE